MAVMREKKSSSNWAFSLKVLLISTGVLSMTIILKLSIPLVLEFMISEIPVFWSCLLSWLTPPYLYVIINGIIITIAASSKFNHHKSDNHEPLLVPVNNNKIISSAPNQQSDFVGYDDTMMMMMMKNSMEVRSSEFEDGMNISYENHHQVDNQIVVGYHEQQHGVTEKNLIGNQKVGITENGTGGMFGYDHQIHHHEAVVKKNLMEFEDLKPKVYEQKQAEEKLIIPERKMGKKVVTDDDFSHDEKENSFMISTSSWTPLNRTDSMENVQTDNVKPPASSRFNHKKSVKASPEGGKTLGVTKPKRHETMETTWKTITDGRSMPLTRHLKKSDTWESRHHNQQDQLTPKLMKKSETFTERHNNSSPISSPSGNKLHKREASLSQDDLNRRVEAFINKFNEDMRLQRQESLNQYNEMVRQR
ncbi:hypothetical protein MKX01_035313 [Papaver californicum]|nr:hypothetical protein MKX01_035313 [Papaver californicum]